MLVRWLMIIVRRPVSVLHRAVGSTACRGYCSSEAEMVDCNLVRDFCGGSYTGTARWEALTLANAEQLQLDFEARS